MTHRPNATHNLNVARRLLAEALHYHRFPSTLSGTDSHVLALSRQAAWYAVCAIARGADPLVLHASPVVGAALAVPAIGSTYWAAVSLESAAAHLAAQVALTEEIVDELIAEERAARAVPAACAP